MVLIHFTNLRARTDRGNIPAAMLQNVHKQFGVDLVFLKKVIQKCRGEALKVPSVLVRMKQVLTAHHGLAVAGVFR